MVVSCELYQLTEVTFSRLSRRASASLLHLNDDDDDDDVFIIVLLNDK